MHGKKHCGISKAISQEALQLLPRPPGVLPLGEASNSAKNPTILRLPYWREREEKKINEKGAARVVSATPASLSHSPGVTHVSE